MGYALGLPREEGSPTGPVQGFVRKGVPSFLAGAEGYYEVLD